MTYSIVARDPDTGALGVAVQSHWFAVGAIVPWARPECGAIATQSFAEPSYGYLGLGRMASGRSAGEALDELLSADDSAARRQVAFVDTEGRVAVHTGSGCIPFAGHVTGDGFSCQANLMLGEGVWDAMAASFAASSGVLAERLLSALEAGEAAGGDIRGSQSAALLVVPGAPSDKPWKDRLVDLRVDDHPQPLAELRRLLTLHAAYELMERAEELTLAADTEGALRAYEAAEDLAREAAAGNPEFAFWRGVALAGTGDPAAAREALDRARRGPGGWSELLDRLPGAGLLERSSYEALGRGPSAGGESQN